jgi:hypothetical protein
MLALFVAAPAVAKPGSEMEVFEYQTGPGEKAWIDIAVHIASTSAPAAHAAVYVPWGYGLDTSQRIGTQIGYTSATLYRGAMPLYVRGSLFTVDPNQYVGQDCSGGEPTAVWIASFTVDHALFNVPVFVEQGSFNGPSQSSYTLHACFNAPAQANGLRVVWLDLSTPAFRNPTHPFRYQWHTLITTYGAAGPDPQSAFEVQTEVPIPQVIKLRSTFDRAHRVVHVSGTLLAAGQPRARAGVELSTAVKPTSGSTRYRGSTTTDANGRFSFSVKLTTTSWVLVGVDTSWVKPCIPSTEAPCVFATISPPPTASLHVRVPASPRP